MNYCPNCGHYLVRETVKLPLTPPFVPSPIRRCSPNCLCPCHEAIRLNGVYVGDCFCNGQAVGETPRFNANSGCLFDNPEYQNKPMGLSCPCPKHSATC